jgi:hypothetical protein
MNCLALLLTGAIAFAQKPPATSTSGPKPYVAPSVRLRPGISVGSINQTPTGNCNVTIGVNAGSIRIGDINCRGVSPQTAKYFKNRLSKVERDQVQTMRDLDNLRQQYVSLSARVQRIAETSETDHKMAELLAAGKIDEASALHKQILLRKEEQAAEQRLDLAQEQLTQGLFSEIQLDWPAALVAYQKVRETLPDDRDAALGYGRALQHLAAAEWAKSADLLKEASDILDTVERDHNPKVAAHNERSAAISAEVDKLNTVDSQVLSEMLKLSSPQGEVKNTAAFDRLSKKRQELSAQLSTIVAKENAELAVGKQLTDELQTARAGAKEQAAPLEAEAERVSVQADARILEAAKVISKPLEELQQLVNSDFKRYSGELLLAIQQQIGIDMDLDREDELRSHVMQSADLQIQIARNDRTAEPMLVLVLEAQRDVMANASDDSDKQDDYAKRRFNRLAQDILNVYTLKAFRNPKYHVFIAFANVMLAEEASDDERYKQANKYYHDALTHLRKTPASLSPPASISFGDRNLWIPSATAGLAIAEGHEHLPEAEKDFRKAIADLTVLAQRDPERYNPKLARTLAEFAEFLMPSGKEAEAREEFEKSVELEDTALARAKSSEDIAEDYLFLFYIAGESQNLSTGRCDLLRKGWAAASKDTTSSAGVSIIVSARQALSQHQCSKEELSQIPEF